MPLTKYW